MPYRRKYNKKRKGRNGRKRYRRNTTRLLRGPVNTRCICKLPYVEQTNLVPGVGGVANALYWCNGLYDPRWATGGHAPMGMDQLMLLYNHYTVVGAKITVKFMGDNTNDFLCGVLTAADTTTTSDHQTLMERQRSRYKLVQKNNETTQTIVSKWSAKKFFSCKAIVGESQYKGGISTNPTEGAFFHVFAGSPDGTTNPTNVSAVIRIEYIAVFSEPIPQDKS